MEKGHTNLSIISTDKEIDRMTQTTGFGWTYSDATHYDITEFFSDGTSRTVSPQYAIYVTWIQSNTPTQIAGNQYMTFPGGVPTYNSVQAATDNAAAALAAAQAFTSSRQWIYFNQIVVLVAADVAAGQPWAVINQATFNLWRTWEMSVLAAFETYVTTPTPTNITALNVALASNPPMNL
jgi:hypothetical protein